jgi:hypothetical protein
MMNSGKRRMLTKFKWFDAEVGFLCPFSNTERRQGNGNRIRKSMVRI